MIALDTNVLVRLVTRDDEAQAQRAKAVFDAHAGEDGGLFVADIVLVELCWTLAHSYELTRKDIARTVHALLDNASIALESPAAVKNALAYFEAGSADFPDCLIVAKASQVGCSHTLSFDRRMKPLPGVQLLLKEGDDIQIQVAGEHSFDVKKKASTRELLSRLRKFRGRLPNDFVFDRLEAHERR